MPKNFEYALIKTSIDPRIMRPEEIKKLLQNRNAIILYKEKLYYIDARVTLIEEIIINYNTKSACKALLSEFNKSDKQYQISNTATVNLILYLRDSTPNVFPIIKAITEYTCESYNTQSSNNFGSIMQQQNIAAKAASTIIVSNNEFPSELSSVALGLDKEIDEIPSTYEFYEKMLHETQVKKIVRLILDNDIGEKINFKNLDDIVLESGYLYILLNNLHSQAFCIGVNANDSFSTEADASSLLPTLKYMSQENVKLLIKQNLTSDYEGLYKIKKFSPEIIQEAYSNIYNNKAKAKLKWGLIHYKTNVPSQRNCHAYIYSLMNESAKIQNLSFIKDNNSISPVNTPSKNNYYFLLTSTKIISASIGIALFGMILYKFYSQQDQPMESSHDTWLNKTLHF